MNEDNNFSADKLTTLFTELIIWLAGSDKLTKPKLKAFPFRNTELLMI